jgi:threonine/homoserine/homoserine lactone efflux protein
MITAPLLGALFGFVSAIPIAGPISALIFSLGMKGKYNQGRFAALGAAIAESLYAFVAIWGFSRFLSHLDNMLLISNAIAAVILAGLGVYFLRSKKMRTPQKSSRSSPSGSIKAFFLGMGISAINPSLIATWTASITTLYSMNLFTFTDANSILFAGGVGLGIFVWFVVLLKLIAKYRERLNSGIIDKILTGVGIALLILAVWMVIRIATTTWGN